MAKKTNAQVKQGVNEALLADLLSLYTHAEEQMLKKVAKRVAKGITEEGWNELKAEDTSALRQEIAALLSSPSGAAKKIMGKNILKAYKEGVNGVEKEAGKPLTAMSKLNVPLSVQNLLLANYNLIDDANSNILRRVDDAYREMMVESSSMLLAGVETRQQASQRMMDKLAAKGITTFVDKAGRTWDMGSYTEMAIRTATAHAALEGRIQTQESLGNDLMQVSRIGTTCPICARWQGVVLSISGKSPGYYTVEQARAAGLFHPNCKHTMIMWDAELDGVGQKELNSDAEVEAVTKVYDLTQKQRANERQIRYWKRRAAGAITPALKAAYQDRAVQATLKNIMFCEQNGLPRMKAREGIRTPNSDNAQFIDWFGKHLSGYSEYEMAKVILDEATLKQMLKDKSESLTTLYKKYIGENPSQDYKSVGDTQLTYAQWLKAKVMELTQDMPDPQEEQYVTIPAKYTDAELKALLKTKSLTEVYKENISGSPTQDYKNNYTGPLTYAQWLKAQVGDLTLEKVVPVSSMPQNQSEIGVASGTKPLGDKPLDGAVKQAYYDALSKLQFEDQAGMFETSIGDVLQDAYWADESLAGDMDKKGQAAIVKNGKIYFNPHKQGSIGPNTVYHELGHLMSVKGLKATTKDFDAAANEVMTSLGYKTFKDMAFKLTSYATTNSQEFFAEAFMLYHATAYDHFPAEAKLIIAEAMQKMYFKQEAQPKPSTKKAKKAKAVKPKDLIAETDKENFAKAKQMLIDKAAKDGMVGMGTLKTAFAQAIGIDDLGQAVLESGDDFNKFIDAWESMKQSIKDDGDYPSLSTITKKLEPLFMGDKIEDLLAFDASHPVAQAKAQAKAEKEAIAKAKAEAKAQAQAQAMASAVQAAKGASGYKLGMGSLTEQEQEDFIAEHKAKHLSGGSAEGKAQAKRLKDAQKKYAKDHFPDSTYSRSGARDLESQVAKALREGDTETLKKIGPVWALHDYSKASGVYNWYKRGVDRGRSVNTGDHALGRGMSEWEYGEKLAPLLDEYFRDMPGLEEDVYVHRVFDEDALQNLFGIETDKAKAAVDLSDAIKYAKKHPGETLIRDKGYLSTSTFTEGSWNGNCEIRIKLNKGTKAAYLGGVEAHDVDEMLVQANQKMRVNAVYERADYSDSEWRQLAQEKGFNPSKKIAIFAETVVDDVVDVTRESKEIQIGEMLAAQSGSSNTKSYDYAAKAAVETELRDEFNRGSKSWTSSEKSGIKAYSGSDYSWMNNALRNGDESRLNATQKSKIDNTKAALGKVRTTKDRVYRRGSDLQSLLGILGEDQMMSEADFVRKLHDDPEYFNSGTRLGFDKGFLSTSPFIDGGFRRDVEYRIFAPAGTKAIYMAPLSQHSGEEETLFQANTKFRIIGVHYSSDLSDEEKKAKLLNKGYAQGATFVVYLEALPDD